MRRRVNVLVCVLLVVIAAGLLLPGIARVRHGQQVTACRNHLRSIAIGLHGYHDFQGAFPAATVPSATLPPARRLSWLFELDPYVHARMDPDWKPDRNKPWDAEENLRLSYPQMPWYICPAVPTVTGAGGLTLTSYVGATGVGVDAADLPSGDPRAGVFGYDRRTARREVTDGEDTTVAVIETAERNGPWTAGGPPTARGLDTGRQPYMGRGWQFGGTHTGGANALFVDGSARFIRDSASPETLAALFTVSAGDRPGSFED
jgi:prepilin-type processing-associated H-X9-DG protein